jgi:hypothetical protein
MRCQDGLDSDSRAVVVSSAGTVMAMETALVDRIKGVAHEAPCGTEYATHGSSLPGDHG